MLLRLKPWSLWQELTVIFMRLDKSYLNDKKSITKKNRHKLRIIIMSVILIIFLLNSDSNFFVFKKNEIMFKKLKKF